MVRGAASLVLGAVLLSSGAARAKSTKDFTYSYKAMWTTAVRLLRVDRGYAVTDQDQKNGFILFVYPGRGSVKECHASLELMAITDVNGYKVVRAVLQIASQPAYVEVDLLDRLERKLLEERGQPPPYRRDPPPPKKKPDEPKKPERPDKPTS
jgi:hypothetical protein